jgi:O-antigen ligase
MYGGDLTRDTICLMVLPLAPIQIGDRWYGTCLGFAGSFWSESIPTLGAFGTANIAMAAGFLFLPISRRRAKVRLRHIFRILMYGAAFVLPAYLVLALGASGALGSAGAFGWATTLRLPAALVAVGGMVIWWSLATKRHLRMPHAWAIGCVLALPAVLGASLVLILAGDKSFQELVVALP